MKICKKCKVEFPCRKIIDGKTRNLSHRRFCLDCSPFGKHNTKNLNKNDAQRPVINGKRPYSSWSEEAKNDMRARLYWKGQNRKKILIEKKGGKCKKCGYCLYIGSLSFHHRDPNLKLFSLDSSSLQTRKWSDIIQELSKCDLLCMNCHMEIENFARNKAYESFRSKYGTLPFELQGHESQDRF